MAWHGVLLVMILVGITSFATATYAPLLGVRAILFGMIAAGAFCVRVYAQEARRGSGLRGTPSQHFSS